MGVLSFGGYQDTSLHGYGAGTGDGSENPMYGFGSSADGYLGVFSGQYSDDENYIYLAAAPDSAEKWLVDGYIPSEIWYNYGGGSGIQSHMCNDDVLLGGGPWKMEEVDLGSVDQMAFLSDISKAGNTIGSLTTFIAGGGIGSGDDWYSGDRAEDYFIDEIQSAGINIIAAGSIALAAMMLYTSYEDSDTGTQHNERSGLWITYGNPNPPTFNLSDSEYSVTYDATGELVFNNMYYSFEPYTLDSEEKVALMAKFGHNPSWIGMTTSDMESVNPLFAALSASMMSIVEAIVTTFPENVLTFARTKPLKLEHNDISNIEVDEEYQDIDFSTTPSTGY